MTTVNILLTEDKETLIAVLGAVEDNQPCFWTDIVESSTVADALEELTHVIKHPFIAEVLLSNFQLAPLALSDVERYGAELVASVEVQNDLLDDLISHLKSLDITQNDAA